MPTSVHEPGWWHRACGPERKGRGAIRIGTSSFQLAPHDIVVVPGWLACTLHPSNDLVLLSYSDRVVQEKLGFFREQRLPD